MGVQLKGSVRMLKTLTIVVPCYNEEEVFPETVKEIGTIVEDLGQVQNVGVN